VAQTWPCDDVWQPSSDGSKWHAFENGLAPKHWHRVLKTMDEGVVWMSVEQTVVV